MIPEPSALEKIPPPERFSSRRLVEDLKKRRLDARYFETTGTLLKALLKEARSGDIILIMSNGAFDNLHQRLLEKL
jgi:UDP-N-acetylmuramate: L-alanyl-gamma-D-glutamyl-meso-diaminopimelate ligase